MECAMECCCGGNLYKVEEGWKCPKCEVVYEKIVAGLYTKGVEAGLKMLWEKMDCDYYRDFKCDYAKESKTCSFENCPKVEKIREEW